MPKTGRVYLVGAGPGDPSLVTLKAKWLIEQADVILYDHLIPASILEWSKNEAQCISVGKQKGAHIATQSQINDLLISHAKVGHIVLRLKGGDPLVFGRAGEEMQVLSDHGIPFEIVPGITSAFAVPAYGGIPITHRHLSRSVALVTGTLDTQLPPSAQSLPSADTLIFLMAVTHLSEIVDHLLSMDRFGPDTPASLIYRGASSQQRQVTGTLASITQQRDDEQISHPSLLVVGKVVGLSKQFQWTQHSPLFGQRIILLRSPGQVQPWISTLSLLGAEVLNYPLLGYEPMKLDAERCLAQIKTATHVIISSRNGVQFLVQALQDQLGSDLRILAGKQLSVVGPKTAEALSQYGIKASLIPSDYSSKGLIDALPSDLGNDEIFIVGSTASPDTLTKGLKAQGATVHHVPFYRPVKRVLKQALDIQENDRVVLTSGELAQTFFEQCPDLPKIKAICFGESSVGIVKKNQQNPVILEAASLDALCTCLMGRNL